MKNDDLERLEKSQDVQQLIHFAKEQYEQEKSEHTPADFSSLMQAVRKNQKKRMRLNGFSLVADSCLSAGMDHRIWLPGWK